MPDPTQRAPPAKKIVKLIGDRPSVWIAPLIWTEARGLHQVALRPHGQLRRLRSGRTEGSLSRTTPDEP